MRNNTIQIIKVRRRDGDVYVPHRFPSDITNDGKTLKYFIRGEGHKQTKAFEILEEELPDKWDRLSWLDIMHIHEKYGINISSIYADTKVPGLVARENVRSRYALFEKARHLLDPEKDRELFELIKPESMLSYFGMYMLDIVATDKALSKADSEYDSENATYRGNPCSIEDYVRIKFGDRGVEIINALIK